MEPALDLDFVGAEEESSGTLLRRKSKVHRGRNLEENVVNEAEKPQMHRDLERSGGENSVLSLATSSLENKANMTVGLETKMNTNFTASEEESSSTLVLITSELNTGRNLKENEVSACEIMSDKFSEIQKSEVNLRGKNVDMEESQVSTVEHTEQHENEKYFDGGNSTSSLSADPSNDSAVLTDVPADSTQLKALSQPSLYYVEDKGSQTNATVGRGSEPIEYESKETEVVVFDMVGQTMTQKQNDKKWPIVEGIWQSYYTDSEISNGSYVTQSFATGKFNKIENINNGKSAFIDSQTFSDTGSTVTVRNGGPTSNQGQNKMDNSGIKEHEHWNGTSKTVLQKSEDGFIGEKDEKKLREHQTRRLEKSALEGNVEDIVKIMKEQKTHDLICPNCGSCITKQVILHKRERTSLVSDGNTDVQSQEHDMTKGHINMPNMSTEHGEEPEAYGCLTCLSLFFRRGAKVDDATKSSQRKNRGPAKSIPEPSESEDSSLSAMPAISSGMGSLLKNDGKKTATVNIAGLNNDIEDVKSDSWSNISDGAKVDDATKSSQRKNRGPAKSILEPSKSEDSSLSAIPAISSGMGSLLKNDGKKTATVNIADLDSYIEDVKSDSWSNISDDELKKPLLGGGKDKPTSEERPVISRDDKQGKLNSPSKSDRAESNSSLETRSSVSQTSEISPGFKTNSIATTVIDIVQPVVSQPGNTDMLPSPLSERPITDFVDWKAVTDWDLLKSIVYGGLTVSITSLGVVSSAAGGEAKTLTVIAISLANLIAGFFLIITNILYLGHFHRGEFEETVGHRFWFNGFIAVLSYLVLGSVAPITYGFSFRKSDDTMYKFLAASLATLISIILLALGKARVNKKSYIKIVILYVVTGFWASFIGFFAGKYIKKLLEKWGFTID